MALTAAVGALLGAKNSSLSNRTSTQTTESNYSPAASNLQDQIYQTLSGQLSSPNGAVAPLEAEGINTINKSSQGLSDRMSRFTASRGFTKSGTANLNQEKIESDRVGQIAGFENNLVPTILNQQNQTLASSLSAAFKPSSTTTTSIAPGNTGAGALSGLFTSLMSQLNQAGSLGAFGGGN